MPDCFDNRLFAFLGRLIPGLHPFAFRFRLSLACFNGFTGIQSVL